MPTATRNNVPPRKAATLDDFRGTRTCWCELPSGNIVKLRPVNMELHAMSGGLPDTLRRMTSLSTRQIQRAIADDEETDAMIQAKGYMDNLVRACIVEPEIPSDIDLDTIFLPADYHFLFQIAQRERDEDATGRRLWGREPISRWVLFREEHGCDEDCEACGRVQSAVSAYGS